LTQQRESEESETDRSSAALPAAASLHMLANWTGDDSETIKLSEITTGIAVFFMSSYVNKMHIILKVTTSK